MKKAMIWAAAMMILVAGMIVTGASSSEAGLFDRIKCKRAAKKCCEPAPCAVEATPACDATDCNCLSKRKLRRANRKGKCCGVQARTCGCQAAAAPEAAPEAPEAPESDSTT